MGQTRTGAGLGGKEGHVGREMETKHPRRLLRSMGTILAIFGRVEIGPRALPVNTGISRVVGGPDASVSMLTLKVEPDL